MSKKQVKWKHVEKYFLKNGYKIYHSGGDAIIKAPSDNDPTRKKHTVRIGHNFSNHRNAVMLSSHLGVIKRAFGVTADDILST